MGLLQALQDRLKSGQAPKCFAKDFLGQSSQADGFIEEEVAFVAGSKHPRNPLSFIHANAQTTQQ